MGDKSPKSKQKNQAQKQSNVDAASQKKQRAIDSQKHAASKAASK